MTSSCVNDFCWVDSLPMYTVRGVPPVLNLVSLLPDAITFNGYNHTYVINEYDMNENLCLGNMPYVSERVVCSCVGASGARERTRNSFIPFLRHKVHVILHYTLLHTLSLMIAPQNCSCRSWGMDCFRLSIKSFLGEHLWPGCLIAKHFGQRDSSFLLSTYSTWVYSPTSTFWLFLECPTLHMMHGQSVRFSASSVRSHLSKHIICDITHNTPV